ncbi:uncharacterized protein ATNIH1004_005762 [Aspergillus tanneri]|uniref:Uncharacterized protein n=1 Tax=Aspergillus tanneri TaxID=1220188 RepID=A0A5M9MR96_9EURO|nr:uncharacterized protein ATNIH1004_005762 [Aspergillus tanneri]KAA8647079.1 hypothetical protein ATNIH1004_005762 [Aspergillus tanneri]
MTEAFTNRTGKGATERGTCQLFRDHPIELDKRERKRYQNRLAQRTYRRNQKQRLQALEAVVAQSSDTIASSLTSHTEVIVPPEPSCDDQIWAIDPVLQEASPSGLLTSLGRTALHRAVCSGNESITHLLLERGANVMKQDGNGQTALHLAAENGCEALVKVLIERTPDLNVTDYLGRTALFLAVQSESETVAKLLLEASIDVNWKDTSGNVALHLAVERGSESLTLLLLQYGANIDA